MISAKNIAEQNKGKWIKSSCPYEKINKKRLCCSGVEGYVVGYSDDSILLMTLEKCSRENKRDNHNFPGYLVNCNLEEDPPIVFSAINKDMLYVWTVPEAIREEKEITKEEVPELKYIWLLPLDFGLNYKWQKIKDTTPTKEELDYLIKVLEL